MELINPLGRKLTDNGISPFCGCTCSSGAESRLIGTGSDDGTMICRCQCDYGSENKKANDEIAYNWW